jgi:hypothetical protein
MFNRKNVKDRVLRLAMPEAPTRQQQQEMQIERQRATLEPLWSRWLSSLDTAQVAVLEKYGLIRDGAPVIVAYKTSLPSRSDFAFQNKYQETRYADSKMSLETAKRLVALDTTSNHAWTDWIFFQAGGGTAAKNRAPETIKRLKHGLFLNKRKELLDAARAKGPITRAVEAQIEARLEAMWQAQEAKVNELANNAEEDMQVKLSLKTDGGGPIFGYAYAYPGFKDQYKKVDEAIRAFFSVYNKAVEMNAEIADSGRKLEPGEEVGQVVPLTPDEMDDVNEMNDVTLTVKQYFQSRFARSDVRLATHKDKTTVYDDDNVTLLVPLTYSAAVKYGNDKWPWADRQRFSADVKQARSTTWNNITQNGLVGYMTVHVPLASTLQGSRASMRRTRFNHFALVTARDSLTVYDESGAHYDYDDFITKLHALTQPEEPPQPTEPDHPMRPSTRRRPPEEVTSVIASIEAAVDEFHQFVATFDNRQVVRDISKVDINRPTDTVPAD